MALYQLKNGFFVDTETGVEYCSGIAIVYSNGKIYYPTCPRYRSDGSLYVLSQNEMMRQIEETEKSNSENTKEPIRI